MKLPLAVILLAVQISAAQTFVNVRMPAFTGTVGNYSSVTNLAVPTNTLVRFVNFIGTDNLTGGTIEVRYAGAPGYPIDIATQDFLGFPVLGPCTNTVTVTSSSSSASVQFLLQLETVNTAASIGGTMVQPAGFSSTIALQTSTNLTTWQTMTNASFPKAPGARFFRMSQAIP